MNRRKFVKKSLVTVGSALLPEAGPVGAGFSQALGSPPPHPQRGALKVKYIREQIPSFDVPALRGVRYADKVPDTLDIAERAKLAINVLTSITDPNAGREVYWSAIFFQNPPVMYHDFNDWIQYVEGIMESLPLLRVATGSSLNAEVDPIWMGTLLKQMGPDGLVYVSLKGRPWSLVKVPDAYVLPVWRSDGSTTHVQDPSVSHVASSFTCQRVLSAMTVYYLRDKNPMWKSTIEKMIDSLNGLAVRRNDHAWFPSGVVEPNCKYGPHAEMPAGFMAVEHGGRIIQGLTQYYRATGYEPGFELAGKLAKYIRYHAQYYQPDGAWLVGPDERQASPELFKGVLQGGAGVWHVIGLLSVLEYAMQARDQELVEFARTGYQWAKANYSSPLIGWFPEDFAPHYPMCESCVVAGMVALGLKLTLAGAGDYWDDVDRWARNHFSESQLTTTDWVYLLAARSPYYLWEHIAHYQEGSLRVNLLLNHACKWVDIHSHLPYEGRVEVKLKQPLENVRVRVPEWVKANSTEVVGAERGERRELRWEGRYVNLGNGKPGDVLMVRFPIPQSRTKESIGNAEYTMEFKGNTVVSIDPAGKNGPLYRRSYYLASRAPTHEIERFVPNETLGW